MGNMVLLTIGIFVIVLFFAINRGAGTTIWFLALTIIFGLISSGISPMLASVIDIGKHKDIENSRGLWQLISFGVLIISAFPLSLLFDRFTQWVCDPADWFFAMLFGFIASFIVAHYLLEAFYFHSHGSTMRTAFENSPLIRQMVQFEGWHNFVNWFNTVLSGEKRPTLDLPADK
jgi:hypothetical protein